MQVTFNSYFQLFLKLEGAILGTVPDINSMVFISEPKSVEYREIVFSKKPHIMGGMWWSDPARESCTKI